MSLWTGPSSPFSWNPTIMPSPFLHQFRLEPNLPTLSATGRNNESRGTIGDPKNEIIIYREILPIQKQFKKN